MNAGTKKTYFLRRTTTDGGERRMPIGVIHGVNPGEQITIFGGQHGTEYAGIEAAMRLFRETDPEDVAGTIQKVLNSPCLSGIRKWLSMMREDGMLTPMLDGSSMVFGVHSMSRSIWTRIM